MYNKQQLIHQKLAAFPRQVVRLQQRTNSSFAQFSQKAFRKRNKTKQAKQKNKENQNLPKINLDQSQQESQRQNSIQKRTQNEDQFQLDQIQEGQIQEAEWKDVQISNGKLQSDVGSLEVVKQQEKLVNNTNQQRENIEEQQQEEQSENEVLVEFRNVHKSFGDKHVLRGVSFKICKGEAVGVIGASGTGKSTALRLIAGLLVPDDGEILIKGKPRRGLLADVPMDAAGRDDGLKIGMVFQSAALFDSLTVGENVGFLLYEHSKLPQRKIEKLVKESLACVGLNNVEHLYPSQLSGGMKKRVALARAIINDQDQCEQILMYDEPTAGLDPVASTVVEQLIRSLHSTDSQTSQGKNVSSYVVVTHQRSTIENAVDKLIFLHKGRVAWSGTVQEYETTDEPIVRQFASGALDGPIKYR